MHIQQTRSRGLLGSSPQNEGFKGYGPKQILPPSIYHVICHNISLWRGSITYYYLSQCLSQITHYLAQVTQYLYQSSVSQDWNCNIQNTYELMDQILIFSRDNWYRIYIYTRKIKSQIMEMLFFFSSLFPVVV